MTFVEGLTVFAIIIGPIAAVQASQFLERKRLKKHGKEWVFKTLMRTRGSVLSANHIEALNMIDVEFYGNGKLDKAVVSAWKLYLDSLGDINAPQEIKKMKRKDHLVDLLHTMAIALEYEFYKAHIKNATYVPQGTLDMENEQHYIRKGVLDVLAGKSQIPMHITNLPSNPEAPISEVGDS